MGSLVFIDTNILLDFYRVRGPESDLSILDHIDENHAHIITSSQVEMEFKKNRPAVIAVTLGSLKSPNWGDLTLPAYLAKSKQSTALRKGRKRVDSLLVTLRDRTRKILENPTGNDPVYKVAQRLFKAKTDCNLARDKKVRFEIRRLARKRFVLGYPPRKQSDTSIGDAINWEWIIRCAEESGKDVVIVSRDSDYGVQLKDGPILNDWLRQEFKERVSRKRQILLTDRLAVAFKKAEISVTPEEEEVETEFLKQARQLNRPPSFVLPDMSQYLIDPKYLAAFADLTKQIVLPDLSKFRFDLPALSKFIIDPADPRFRVSGSLVDPGETDQEAEDGEGNGGESEDDESSTPDGAD